MEETSGLLEWLSIINRYVDEHLFVFEYTECSKILGKMLRTSLLKEVVDINMLIDKSLRLRKLLRSELGGDDYEHFGQLKCKVLYTAVAASTI